MDETEPQHFDISRTYSLISAQTCDTLASQSSPRREAHRLCRVLARKLVLWSATLRKNVARLCPSSVFALASP